MKKKRKVLYLALLIVLVVCVGSLYNSLNGNPVSKWLAKRELQQFITKTYPDKELRIKEGMYNFKFKTYHFAVVEIGTTGDKGAAIEHEFEVRGLKPEVVTDGIRMDNLDLALMEKLSEQAGAEIKQKIAAKVAAVKNVTVQLQVVQGQMASGTAWSKSLKFDEPLYIHIVLDSTKASKEEVLAAAQDIQSLLNAEGYDYRSFTINGNVMGDEDAGAKDEFGYVKYSIGVDKNSKKTLKDVREFSDK
ncbi:hypothetical protein [Paenibacillus lutrae]|uniref:Uncharacterized protein n=1 Tax=Paenibacillus lutrae TaxID=2078573 RepID=A0A7X3FKA6_9BACL|nr:hypothetical protein [Paenibacillus lutrae]MVP01304.1 hypothetical protein [Paenibacillus lutrae]